MYRNREEYYRHNQVEPFRDEISNQYSWLCKKFESVSFRKDIVSIIDPDGINQLEKAIDCIQIYLRQHLLKDYNFFHRLNHTIEAHIFWLTTIIKEEYKPILGLDIWEFWYNLSNVLRTYLSLDDRAFYSDSWCSISYEQYLIMIWWWKDSFFSREIFELCINHLNLPRRKYVQLRQIIAEYLGDKYLPAIKWEYDRIFFDRDKISTRIKDLYSSIQYYQDKSKICSN